MPSYRDYSITTKLSLLALLAGGVALVFSTKYEPARPLLDHWKKWEELKTRFFGFHRDLPPAALAHVLDQITPGRRGELLTTAEMARRCGIATKTLLKHKASGKVRPALQRGKLIRWRGDEVTTV